MASATQCMSQAASLGLYPPPSDAARYSTKPLPPLPRRRKSGLSAFSAEVGDAFVSPTCATNDLPFMFDWEQESPGKPVRLSQDPSPDDMAVMRAKKKQQRLREQALSALRNPKPSPMVRTVGQTAGPRSAGGLERATARAMAGPASRPQRHTFPKPSVNSIIIQTVLLDEVLSPQPKSSAQKILKLTGNMRPSTALSTDTPTLHNSSQKIRQLTGLGYSPRRGSEPKLHILDDELSTASVHTSSSVYSPGGRDEFSYYAPAESLYSDLCVNSKDEFNTPVMTSSVFSPGMRDDISYYASPESLYSNSYMGSINELSTHLTAPRYAESTPPPTLPSNPRGEGSESPVSGALRISAFIAADIGVATGGDMTPMPGIRGSRLVHSSEAEKGEEIYSSSSSEISESEFELEPTAAELYHVSAVAIAKSSPKTPSNEREGTFCGPPLPAKLQKMGWDNTNYQAGNDFPLPPSRSSTHGSIGSSTIDSSHSDSQSTSRAFSRNPFRKKDNTLSEHRGHNPAPIDNAASSYPRSWGKSQTQRMPHPPVSSSLGTAVDEATAGEDAQTRNSLLGRLFTSGMVVGIGGSAASSKAPSVASGRGSIKTDTTAQIVTGSAWSPDTPSPGSGTFGDVSRNSGGLLAWTMDHARNAAGRKGKADKDEKAERARVSLRGKIKVLREEKSGGDDG